MPGTTRGRCDLPCPPTARSGPGICAWWSYNDSLRAHYVAPYRVRHAQPEHPLTRPAESVESRATGVLADQPERSLPPVLERPSVRVAIAKINQRCAALSGRKANTSVEHKLQFRHATVVAVIVDVLQIGRASCRERSTATK